MPGRKKPQSSSSVSSPVVVLPASPAAAQGREGDRRQGRKQEWARGAAIHEARPCSTGIGEWRQRPQPRQRRRPGGSRRAAVALAEAAARPAAAAAAAVALHVDVDGRRRSGALARQLQAPGPGPCGFHLSLRSLLRRLRSWRAPAQARHRGRPVPSVSVAAPSAPALHAFALTALQHSGSESTSTSPAGAWQCLRSGELCRATPSTSLRMSTCVLTRSSSTPSLAQVPTSSA